MYSDTHGCHYICSNVIETICEKSRYEHEYDKNYCILWHLPMNVNIYIRVIKAYLALKNNNFVDAKIVKFAGGRKQLPVECLYLNI